MCQISDQPSLAQVGAYGCRRPEMLACGGARAAKGAGFRVRWLSAFGGSNPLPRISLTKLAGLRISAKKSVINPEADV